MQQELTSTIPNTFGAVILIKPNPPYIEKIPDWLKTGTTITIQGKAEQGVVGFSVNLSSHPCLDPLPDTALHMDVRLQKKVIVLNNYKHGKWGLEERIQDKYLLKQDLSFELMIMITKYEFMIFFHDIYHLSFSQRMDSNTAKYLIIKGPVQIEQIRIDGTTIVPPASLKPAFLPIFNPKTPFDSSLLKGLRFEKIIIFSGYPSKYNPKRFTLNLRTEGDIAFHFDVRMVPDNQVVRNSLIAKSWGEEETYKPFFPFQPGVGFDLMLVVGRNCYKVAVNSQHYITFQHRIKDIAAVNHIQVIGDVHLTMVQYY